MVVALCLTACHCERRTTGTPCRKAACACAHGPKHTCKCHHMGKHHKDCKCPHCKAHHPKHKHGPMAHHPGHMPKAAAANAAAEQKAALAQLGEVKTQKNKVALSYKEPIQFDHNSATIESTSYKELDTTANVLKKYPNAKITVKGYTDASGNAAYNVDLSQRRAQAVADALVKRGVPAANVSAVGYGAAHPIASNDTPQGRRQNRRVELEIENK